MAELTYWEKNFSGDIYNTNPTAKVGINNGDPLNTLDVIGSIGLTEYLEIKKTGHDIIQVSSASELGYDLRVRNVTDNRSLLYIDNLGRVAINTNVNTARLTIIEDRAGNAWPAASFTNTSEVGFGLEVTGGNAGNNILTLKNYQDLLRGTLDGYGNWRTQGWMWSDNGASVGGNHHYTMGNENYRFSQLLIDEETGFNNEGSNFIWGRYADDGTLLAYILKVIRNSGLIQWFGDTIITGGLTITGELKAGEVGIPLETILDPTGQEGKIIVVGPDEEYEFVDPCTLCEPDLSDYYTKPEVDDLLDELESKIPVITPVSLDDVCKVGNVTEEVVETTASIVTPIVNIGNTQIKEIGGTLNITNDTHIQGLISFEDINLNIWELDDVSDSVANAPSTHILQKLSGEWVAVPLPETDLTNYYTKPESDERFVMVSGDTMTGPLTINTPSNNLQLISQAGTVALDIHDAYTITNNTTDVTIEYELSDYYLNNKDLGTIMHVDDAGTVYFGDPTKTSVEQGKVVIQNETPSMVLHSVTSDDAFRIYTAGGTTYFHVGTGLGFDGMATPMLMNSTNVELNYNNDKKFETTATGVKVYNDLETTTAHVDGVHLYKASDGSFIIDGDVHITGKYLEDWGGVGTGNPPGAWTLNELEDVDMGAELVSGVGFPFLFGRTTPTGPTAGPITVENAVTLLDVVTNPTYELHAGDTDIHITTTERINWTESYIRISETRDWDLTYSSHGYREIGLAHVDESGSAIGDNNNFMKYMFYWDTAGGPKWSVKTRFSDDSDHLGQKPADEYRYSRALGFSEANADTVFERSLYDLGTTTVAAKNVPQDGSWQLETLDASYIFNQNEEENIKHKHQWATRWVDRENYFDLWARTHDGSVPGWLPWVKFFHSGNMPDALEFYPNLPQEALDELEDESNWYRMGDPIYEVYVGEVSGVIPPLVEGEDPTLWEINIGQRIVNKYYIYEATPTGMRRTPKTTGEYLYNLLDVDFNKYSEETELNTGDVLVYQGDETWKPESTVYTVQVEVITATESSIVIPPETDRLEITVEVTASNPFDIVIDHNREKPLVIDLNNLSSNNVSVKYTDDVNPDELLLVMQPDAIIEVHPGVWELN